MVAGPLTGVLGGMQEPKIGTMYRMPRTATKSEDDVLAVTGHDFEGTIFMRDSSGKKYRFNVENLQKAIEKGLVTEAP